MAATPVTLDATAKKANHQANIILITAGNRRPHPDPETTDLELIDIPGTGFQVVTRKGQFSDGDYGIYIQPDSVVPQTTPFKFIWGPDVTEEEIIKLELVPEKKRRITVRRFRGQYSEGLLLPVVDFPELVDDRGNLPLDYKLFDDVSDVLGITHYDPDADKVQGTQATRDPNAPKKKFKYPRSIRGWFGFITRFLRQRGNITELTEDVPFQAKTYDVEGFKNHSNVFEVGEKVVVTEKIHGSNARFLWLEGRLYVGSRNQWKAPGSGSTWHKAVEQNEWIEQWCREHEGFILYGEIVPTQGKFTYGAKPGQVKFFAFDILDPDGSWLDYDAFNASIYTERVTNGQAVPLLYVGPYYVGLLEKMAQGPSWVHGAQHIREGCVCKTRKERIVRGLGRAQLKLVANAFLEKDSK